MYNVQCNVLALHYYQPDWTEHCTVPLSPAVSQIAGFYQQGYLIITYEYHTPHIKVFPISYDDFKDLLRRFQRFVTTISKISYDDFKDFLR